MSVFVRIPERTGGAERKVDEVEERINDKGSQKHGGRRGKKEVEKDK